MSIQQEKFTEIADAIRAKTGKTDLIKPSEFADKIEDVYDAGAKSEYDKFWDAFQDNGKRTDYIFGFAGKGWTDKTFKPKYVPLTGAFYQGFASCRIRNLNADLLILSGHCGLMFNCSSSNVSEGYGITNITGTLDLTNVTNIDTFFNYCYSLTNVECIKMPKSMLNTTNMFNGCRNLVEIRFDISSGGYIGKNTTFVNCTKLSHDSLISILNALYNYSGSGTTYTLTIGTTNLAKLTDAEKAIATEKGWTLA